VVGVERGDGDEGKCPASRLRRGVTSDAGAPGRGDITRRQKLRGPAERYAGELRDSLLTVGSIQNVGVFKRIPRSGRICGKGREVTELGEKEKRWGKKDRANNWLFPCGGLCTTF